MSGARRCPEMYSDWYDENILNGAPLDADAVYPF